MYCSQAYAQTTVIDKKGTKIIVRDSTTADNGLTMTAKNIQLGGSLIQSTTLTQNSQILTIATGGSQLNITGLPSGSLINDSVLVVDPTTGRIKRTTYSFPEILVSATRTAAYTISTSPSYAILPYNSATINIGSVYNTTSGVFTASSTGVYQVIVNNMLTSSFPSNSNARLRIVVNGSTDTEVALSFSPYFSTVFGTISANTIVNLTAGQTINIQMGNASGTIAPSVGANEHTLKIVRLK